jgi:hypothetical protein
MSIIQHDNKIHQNTCNLAESTRQTAVAAAISAGGSSTTVSKAIQTSEAAYFRAVIASCVANGIESAVFRQGLFELSGSRT